MKFLDRWLKPRTSAIVDPRELTEMLLTAYAICDEKHFVSLCLEQQADIIANFADWQKVPDAVRANSVQLETYVQGLIAIARYFHEELDHPELLARLDGEDGSSNLFNQWEQVLRHTQQLEEGLHYRDAAKELEELLLEIKKSTGPGADRYLAIAQGHLARTYLQNGEAHKALIGAETALRMCREQDDLEGITIYLRGLHEVHRYLGAGPVAAEYADQLADSLEAQGDASATTRWRKLAELARAGEPLNRVIVDIEGQQFELQDTPRVKNGTVRFLFERNRKSLRVCEVLTEHGKRLAADGRYEEALRRLREAADADRYDPDPHYHTGVALLHLGRYIEAAESYEAAEVRAPAWFHCCTMHWLACQLRDGRLTQETFFALRTLGDDNEMGAEEKVCLAEEALASSPNLGILYLHYGSNLQASDRRGEALAAYCRGPSCAEDAQTQARLLVNRALTDSNIYQQRACLELAASSNADLVSAATAYLFLRDMPPPAQ